MLSLSLSLSHAGTMSGDTPQLFSACCSLFEFAKVVLKGFLSFFLSLSFPAPTQKRASLSYSQQHGPPESSMQSSFFSLPAFQDLSATEQATLAPRDKHATSFPPPSPAEQCFASPSSRERERKKALLHTSFDPRFAARPPIEQTRRSQGEGGAFSAEQASAKAPPPSRSRAYGMFQQRKIRPKPGTEYRFILIPSRKRSAYLAGPVLPRAVGKSAVQRSINPPPQGLGEKNRSGHAQA